MEKGIDHIGITIVYYCHDGNGNVLMQLRGAGARDERGRWDVGAGALELGEEPLDTLRREIREEYGVSVISHEFLGFRNVLREHEGRRTHWLALDHKVHVSLEGLANKEPHKFDKVGIFPRDELPRPLHSQFPKFLELYADRLY